MYLKTKILVLFLLAGLIAHGQSFTYSYKDPCNGTLKSLIIPTGQNTVSVTYYNQIQTFSIDDFSNGVFDKWVSNTYGQYSVVSPCSGLAFTNSTKQTQELSSVLTGVINTLSGLSFPNPNAPDPNEPAPTPDISSGGSSDGGGGSDVLSGTSKSVGSSGGSGGGSGKSSNSKDKQNSQKPTVIGSADLLAFSNTDASKGGKVSGGYTSTRWDGIVSHGLLFDYSTSIQGPNITGFYSFINPKRINLISSTVSLGFANKGLLYNTLALGQLRTIDQVKFIYMLAGTYGEMYNQKLIGTALISGFMYDMKLNKKIQVKFTGLFVYSPYMQYYNDLLLKSPYVILPSIGTNLSVSKSFKFNVNVGGAYQVNSGTLNYTVTVGTRLAL